MRIDTKDYYSELYQVLDLLGKEYINKIPNTIIDMLKEKRNKAYNPKYTLDVPLEKQNISTKTMAMIALLHLNYWCESENEKKEIRYILQQNEDKLQEELRKKYNPDNLFKKQITNINQQVDMLEYKESKWKKIVNKIKKLFQKSK